jgi:phage terminase small subunit
MVVIVSSQTRTGSMEKPVQNPSVAISLAVQRELVKTGVKFGLSPLDRPRIFAPEKPPPDEPEDGDDGL